MKMDWKELAIISLGGAVAIYYLTAPAVQQFTSTAQKVEKFGSDSLMTAGAVTVADALGWFGDAALLL